MLKNNKKESWEWRCFYEQEKYKKNLLHRITFDLPKPKNIEYIDKYIIIPKLSHNIKLRITKDSKLEELHIKTIIKTQNNIFKFSRKTKLSFPIIENDLLKLKTLKILNENSKIQSLNSIKDIFNIEKNNYSFCLVKKNIVRYNIKKDLSKYKKDIRLEFANVYINNILHKTISLKCTSIAILTKVLEELDMLQLERTNYLNYIKSLEII
jgi:hypothetical protein|tara:strand:+ start:4732 stop:5361 length:630 start_codon:yes stop_codon:yes gene_type:complete